MSPSVASAIQKAARLLSREVSALPFSAPIAYVYNPLEYARAPYEQYVDRYVQKARILFLGMNPGPFGMAQTGIPFGEVGAVRDWLRIDGAVGRPRLEHPKRPILGLACPRREVSGQRLWGLFQERFRTPERFFGEHQVANYCPLVFMDEGGRNITPDKLRPAERAPMFSACDDHLEATIRVLGCEWVVGIGQFAETRALEVVRQRFSGTAIRVGRIAHPSPASPAANRGWAELATRALVEQGIWATG